MTPREWERYLVKATEKVRRKVSPIARREGRGKKVGVGAAGDITIYADRAAEDELLRSLGGRARILSEEAGSVGDGESEVLAIVDPLDGSSNFARGIPFYCTSVAIARGTSTDDVTVGVVRDLVSGDVYSSVRGGGARKNGKRIHTSRTGDVSKAVVGVDFGGGGEETARRLAPLVGGARRQVHFGADALELCFVAEGRTDALVDLRGRIRVTDLAAALLIAQEAGGVVTQEDGREVDLAFDLGRRLNFVASANQGLHRQILQLIGGGAERRSMPS